MTRLARALGRRPRLRLVSVRPMMPALVRGMSTPSSSRSRPPPSQSPVTPIAVPSPPASSAASLLKDEYSVIDQSAMHKWRCPTAVTLESGRVLEGATVAYQTYGALNDAGDNAMLVCHALTGHAALHDWWGSLLGAGKPFDTNKYFIVCCNLLGSCYGSTGPADTNPATNRVYGPDFPVVTVRDSVQLHRRLLWEHLGVTRVSAVIGGSLGGMQALEWAFLGPDTVQCVVALACNAAHSAWQIAINHVQRQAIYSDPKYKDGHYDRNDPPALGLSLARQFAMISYRTHPVYDTKFGRSVTDSPSPNHRRQGSDAFEVERYLLYQGNKLLSRFDANSYIRLTQVLDSHDVGRGRGGCAKALGSLPQPVLVMGVDSDVLYPMHEQEELAAMIPNAQFEPIQSLEGHDGFLLEQEQIGRHIQTFLGKHGQPLATQRRRSASSQHVAHKPQAARAKL